MIETLNVTLVTYLGGFIQYWLHKIILVVLYTAYFTEVKWPVSKKSIISQGSREVQHFAGGPTFFVIPNRNPYNL